MSKEQKLWQVGFYQDQHGKSPVLDFVNKLPVKERAKIDITIKLLQEFGTELKMPHARPVRDHIWELRPGSIRLLYFAYVNHRFVILHGFRKTTNPTPEHDLDTAIRRMNELLKE